MRSTTFILFMVLWSFTTTFAVEGTSQQNTLSSLENYLDFHINRIRMKRQVSNLTNKDTASTGPIAKNERVPTTDMHDPPSPIKNQSEDSANTQLRVELTQVREENRIINVKMAEVRGRNNYLEAMNAQLQKQYTDILRELERREMDFSRELIQLREDIFLLEARLSLNREIMAYRELIDGNGSTSESRNQAASRP